MELHISVRRLVEFILRYGDIDNRKGAMHDDAMQEGGRLHRIIQRRMGAEYIAEVSLKKTIDRGDYLIIIEGRADGIIESEDLPVIDEIKCTYADIYKMKEANPIHLAQAKCYAFMYLSLNEHKHIQVRMTYCNIETEEIKYFHYDYTREDLENWFDALIKEYGIWSDFEYQWKQKSIASIKKLCFPFPYRDGQKELASYVYQTIYHQKKLYIEAPTGVGKTISTLFPAIKAVGEGLGEKIFYLTAKTITRTVASNTFSLLRNGGLQFKTVVLTAKDKICFMEETDCNTVHCPYAKGHYDRINNAVFQLLTKGDNFDRDTIERCAREHQVCPFELCLDMSLFSDGIIGDYNYLFDPHASLKRFFSQEGKQDYLFLIDEAHNLVERGRSMYSAVLKKEDFLELRRKVKEYDSYLGTQLSQCNKELLALKRECEDYVLDPELGGLLKAVMKTATAMDRHLEDFEDSPVKKDVLELYFIISHFLSIYERLDEHYVTYSLLDENSDFFIRLFCVNPSLNLEECMKKGRSSILFSATFLPIQYYKKLLGGTDEDYEVYAKSIFDENNRLLMIAKDVTSKFTRRTKSEYERIAEYIRSIIKCRPGNYMVFFPSYRFLREITEIVEERCAGDGIACLIQEEYMNEDSRESFLDHFVNTKERIVEDTLVGFCVLGGIFSEGIDLKKEGLIGAVIVGTGLPMVCIEREILKKYFDDKGDNGFDYAYRYPGMNKVQQAAGRVIRTEEDKGIIALLDERFLGPSYLNLFPKEWKDYIPVTQNKIEEHMLTFWKNR